MLGKWKNQNSHPPFRFADNCDKGEREEGGTEGRGEKSKGITMNVHLYSLKMLLPSEYFTSGTCKQI